MKWLKKTVSVCVKKLMMILRRKNLHSETSSNEANYIFHALTPIDSADLGIYESAFEFVFSNNSVKNVAVSGAYGSGKSTILESYKRKHPDKRFLHISLTHFRPELDRIGDEDTAESSGTDEDTAKKAATDNTLLEGKILNQLIHQIPAKSIPLTNFRVKKNSSRARNVKTTLLAVLGLVLGAYVFYFSRWVSFIDTLTSERLRNLISLTTHTEMRLVASVAFLFLFGVFIYFMVKLQESHNLIKKAAISGVEIEIFNDSSDSFFDKYLNEVLYLFNQIEEDVVVFEDIDRYDSSGIFERLHEVNRLVNNNRKGKPPLRFFFLLKDDIFISKDRSKFFDFIIPIVPVIDGSNSFDMFLACFEKSGIVVDDKSSNRLNTEFLQGLSLYIDDMRILQNICNEFSVYHSRISTTEQDENKMFALIAYKNLFPRDFSELQLGQGFMFEIIGGRGKERLIVSERRRLNSEIKRKHEELEKVKSEEFSADELAFLFVRKIVTNQDYRRWDADTCRERIEEHRRSHADIIIEYDKRIAHAANNAESKENRIKRIERDILKLNDDLSSLLERLLRSLLTRESTDSFFADAVFTSETGKAEPFSIIKDSPYFAMLKYLVREGYIDETYSDYMTYFYARSLKRVDKIFLRSVTDKKRREETYKLSDPNLVASRLPEMYFEQEETLNFSLFDFLLSDYVGGKKYASKTERFIKQIRENELYVFLKGYAASSSAIDNLIIAIGTEWKDFVSDYFVHHGISDYAHDDFMNRVALELLYLVGDNPTRISFVSAESKTMFVRYVSNDADFLNTDALRTHELAIGIRLFNIEFVKINTEIANKELLRLVYENNSYAMNYENIFAMLQEYYSAASLGSVPTSGYTIIMSNGESPLAKYVTNNIDGYIDVVLKRCSGVITDSEKYALFIINNKSIDMEKRIEYISYLNTVISDLNEIDDADLWGELLKNTKVLIYTAENVVAYFENCCADGFSEQLINYINAQRASIFLENVFADEEQKRVFFNALVRACALNNVVYEGYLSQLNFRYNELEIDSLTIEKLSILDKLNKVGMSVKSLNTLREHYPEYLYAFVCNHIEDYLNDVSIEAPLDYDEILVLLDKDITVEHKVELLKLTSEVVSLKGKKYPDKLSAYILDNHYDEEDFEYLIGNYEQFGQQTKAILLRKAIQQLQLLQSILVDVPRELISDILSSDDVKRNDKHEIFKTVALKATEYDVKEWLGAIGLGALLDVYDKNKRPKFENTEIITAILDIFKRRGVISDYAIDEGSEKYKIRRNGTFDSNGAI